MNTPAAQQETDESWLAVVKKKIEGIRFGSIQITVHEGRVTQVEAVEKTRFSPEKSDPARPAKR